MPKPVKLDFSKAVPIADDGAVKLDFSKAQPVEGTVTPTSTDPSGRTPTGEPAPDDTRNALQRTLDNLITPDPRREEWQSPGRNMADTFARGVAENVVPLVSHPIQSIGGMLRKAGQAIADNPVNLTGALSDFAIKPLIEQGVSDYQSGGLAKAIPHMAGTGTGIWATGELGGKALKPVTGKVGTALRAASDARIGKAHEAILSDVGGDYVPREQSSKTLNVIRNQAAKHPEIVKVINGKDPQAAVAAHINLLDKTIKSIDDLHDAARIPVQNFQVDPTPVVEDFLPSESKFKAMPEAQQHQLAKLAERIIKAESIEDLNNLRIQLGEEDLGARDMQTEPSPGYKTTLHKAANAVREAYYKRLAEVTGKDFTEIKRIEGALKEERHFAQKKQPSLSQAEVKSKTATGRERVGNLISSSAHGSMGIPLVSAAADAVRGTDLANIQTHLQTLYSHLPEHVPMSVPGGMPPVRGALPARATSPLRPGLPASVIPNADEFGAVDSGRIPPRGTNFNVKPGDQAYPHEAVRPGTPPPATGPTVPPKPSEFLRLQAGEPGRVGAKYVEQVGARPASPNQPPPVNPSTAFERVTPKPGGNISVPNAGRFQVIEARPNGEMVIRQTRQLPSGERDLLPATASPSTVTPSSPQLPPVGYTFTGPDGVVRTVTKVGKDGTVTLKEVPKKTPGDLLRQSQ